MKKEKYLGKFLKVKSGKHRWKGKYVYLRVWHYAHQGFGFEYYLGVPTVKYSRIEKRWRCACYVQPLRNVRTDLELLSEEEATFIQFATGWSPEEKQI